MLTGSELLRHRRSTLHQNLRHNNSSLSSGSLNIKQVSSEEMKHEQKDSDGEEISVGNVQGPPHGTSVGGRIRQLLACCTDAIQSSNLVSDKKLRAVGGDSIQTNVVLLKLEVEGTIDVWNEAATDARVQSELDMLESALMRAKSFFTSYVVVSPVFT